MNDFEIRRARCDDAKAIADVHLDARREAMPWLPVLHSSEDTIAYFAEHVLLHEEVLVARANHLVVGFIALQRDHIDHLYIAPVYQRRRIGDRLLAIAKELRPDGLTLWTFQCNARARRFYEARGFVASEFTDGSVTKTANPTCFTYGGRVRQAAAPERVNVRFVVGIERRRDSYPGRPFSSFYSGLKKPPVVRIRNTRMRGRPTLRSSSHSCSPS
jgi:GNAT superfamily N-acetyltransferase